MIGPKTSIGNRPHRVTLQNPGTPIPDGDGGSTVTWTDLVPPAVNALISPATAQQLERIASGTVLATASYIVKMPYHAQVTNQTRILFNGRQFSVTGGGSPDELHQELELACVEIVA